MLNSINLLEVVELRTLVLSLGEAPHFGWWKSQFLSPTGLSFLEHIYPNSRFAQAVRSASIGALEVHDANIGKGSVFHLFRLSQNMEIELDKILTENGRLLDIKFKDLLGDKQKLLSELANLGGDQSEAAFGPILVKISGEKIVPTLAGLYLKAFLGEKPIFPYFERVQ